MVIRSTGKMRNEQTKMLPIIVVQALWIINFIPMSETLKCQKMKVLESLKHSVVSNPQNVSAKEVWYPLTSLRCCPCKTVVIVICMIILPSSYWAVICARNSSKLFAWISFKHCSAVLWENYFSLHFVDEEIEAQRGWATAKWQSESQIQTQVELNLKVMIILFK